MEIISFKRGENEGALFIHGEKRYSACTAVESSKFFKTLKGAISWLNSRGYKEALKELLVQVEENERLQIENKDMKPKVEYFDEIVDRNGLTNFRDTAKLLGVSEKALIFLLIDKKYIYRDQKGKLKPIARYVGNYLELKEWAKGEKTGT